MHIQWYLMGRVSLVNQVVGVQGQGEQRHGKDLKFSRRSFMNIKKMIKWLLNSVGVVS